MSPGGNDVHRTRRLKIHGIDEPREIAHRFEFVDELTGKGPERTAEGQFPIGLVSGDLELLFASRWKCSSLHVARSNVHGAHRDSPCLTNRVVPPRHVLKLRQEGEDLSDWPVNGDHVGELHLAAFQWRGATTVCLVRSRLAVAGSCAGR